MTKQKKPFFKYCSRCGDLFYPTGRQCKICDKCKKPTGFKTIKKLKTCPYYQNGGRCTNIWSGKVCVFMEKFEKCEFYKDSPTEIK